MAKKFFNKAKQTDRPSATKGREKVFYASAKPRRSEILKAESTLADLASSECLSHLPPEQRLVVAERVSKYRLAFRSAVSEGHNEEYLRRLLDSQTDGLDRNLRRAFTALAMELTRTR